MAEQHTIKVLAHIRSPYKTKFGIPRQSGLVEGLEAEIVFEPEFRNPDAFRGIEGYSRLWLIWQFSQAVREDWSPTVRPPRLGGNTRMGVFATRSPFRPNPIGLSCVELKGLEITSDGPVLKISGADLMDGTPIYDIKPYVAYADSFPDALGGFTATSEMQKLEVVFPDELLTKVPEVQRPGLISTLELDPRPRYQKDPERVYGMDFDRQNIKFRVADNTLTVLSVENL